MKSIEISQSMLRREQKSTFWSYLHALQVRLGAVKNTSEVQVADIFLALFFDNELGHPEGTIQGFPKTR